MATPSQVGSGWIGSAFYIGDGTVSITAPGGVLTFTDSTSGAIPLSQLGTITLDSAYDGGSGGGSGAGRAITADSGAVVITNAAANATNCLELSKAPAAAQGGACLNALCSAAVSSAASCANFDFRGTTGTAAGNGIVNVGVGAATVLTGQLVGIECDLSTSLTPGAVALIGARVLVGATTRANTAGEGALVVSSQATLARSLDVGVANTSGTIAIIRYPAATVLATNPLVGLSIDLSTNVTAGVPAVTGLSVTIPACQDAASRGVLVTSSQEAGWGFRADMSGTGAVGGMNIQMGSNATGAPLTLGVDASQEATTGYIDLGGTRIFRDAGAPNNANGIDGDLFIRSDGTAGTRIYSRDGGVWAAIA